MQLSGSRIIHPALAEFICLEKAFEANNIYWYLQSKTTITVDICLYVDIVVH